MSILPSQTQAASSSSSSAPSPNPNPQHGIPIHSLPQPFSSLSPPLSLAFGSLQISDNPGPSTPAAQDSGGSSEKVTELGSPSDMKVSPQQNSRMHSRSYSRRRIGAVSTHRHQQTPGSLNSHGSAPSAGRKAQMVNGNYLLNFHYDPISRSQPRGPPPPPTSRRQRKRKPYNKDLFLQANYKFMVLDSGNYSPESMDPDKMLQWEDIICVTYFTPIPVQCPICLERPLCPQITSCGHIFCFPCILQYLLLGEEDHKGDCWKRCPLCFVMISAKDLYTLHITDVKQYGVGDNVEFTFLTRKKDSFTLSHKNKKGTDVTSHGDGDLCDPFCKFTLTSDVDLSVRHAISDLDGWLARADSGLVDDLEKLPYVCAAMQQLEQRKRYWNEHRSCDSEKSSKLIDYGHQIPSTDGNAVDTDDENCSNGSRTSSTDFHDQSKVIMLDKSIAEACSDNTLDVEKELIEQEVNLSSSYEDKNGIERHSNGTGDAKENDSYNFYQAADGQHLILHPLNMKCLLHHYGSYDMLPHRISGRILQLETITQSEAMRRRYRFLSHFPLTTTFQLCEVDLSEMLPPEALAPFMDEIKKRANQRKQLAKKERKEKIKAEATSTYSLPIPLNYQLSSRESPPTFSMDDFEALGNSTMSSSPPVVGERKSFSNVTRLGFAAGHDSPSLQIQETSGLPNTNMTTDSSATTGLRNGETQSYSHVISRAESNTSLNVPKTNDLGKKGKKPNRVLLSTAGGRRY
ncbi:RING finger protein 10 isoform X2 [Abrus precatorius]|uniref:RING finger protein 10 isoform X2 n=1 Tax=Abrus precatorius TaxID=3816 RepID=A0A8B8L2S2_ABRPR|nr:RING finger protein 10 isoform X2 [Abrus precatorius]